MAKRFTDGWGSKSRTTQDDSNVWEEQRKESLRRWDAFLEVGACPFCDYQNLVPSVKLRADQMFRHMMSRHVKRNILGDDYSE